MSHPAGVGELLCGVKTHPPPTTHTLELCVTRGALEGFEGRSHVIIRQGCFLSRRQRSEARTGILERGHLAQAGGHAGVGHGLQGPAGSAVGLGLGYERSYRVKDSRADENRSCWDRRTVGGPGLEVVTGGRQGYSVGSPSRMSAWPHRVGLGGGEHSRRGRGRGPPDLQLPKGTGLWICSKCNRKPCSAPRRGTR